MEKEINNSKEHLATPEDKGFIKFLTFDSVKVRLISSSKETVAFCTDYFQPYVQVGNYDNRSYDWTISDIANESTTSNFWAVDEKNKEIIISSKNHDSRFATRVLRSLVMLEDISHGKVMFKGASFINRNGNGIVLMGDKRVGKTSIILSYMLKNDPQAKFITNSHVALNLESGRPYAHGYPMSVGIRLGVLESMQRKGNKNIDSLIYHLKNNMKPGEKNRYYLDPNILSKFFQNRITGKVLVNSIILIKSIPSYSSSAIRSMSIEDAENFFKEYQLKYYNLKNSRYNLFKVDSDTQINSIKEILKNINLYELTYNVGSQMETMELIDHM